MHASARRPGEILRTIARISAALVLAFTLGITNAAEAQTTLPLLVPSAIAFDAQGNLYVADAGSHIVTELSAAGVVTTVAGNGVQGFAGDGGAAASAELDSPIGLALDAAGNLYIADSHNHRVREVAASGVIMTLAGVGTAGYSGDGGVATMARLDLPSALAVDAKGNLYVADTDNHRVRRIAAGTGIITTAAGNGVEGFAGDGGAATAASIDSPNGLATDSAGDLYIADTHNGRVRVVSAATGLISTVAGTGAAQGFGGDGGAAAAAALALPRGLTMDAAGNLYVADSDNHRIRRISPAGVMTTVAGQGTEGFAGDGAPAVAANLDTPRAVAISAGGLLTLADTANQRVRQVDGLPAPGPDIHTIAGVGVAATDSLSLNGPSTTVYGSGSLMATLTATGLATGNVTFVDTKGGVQVTLGSAGLVAGAGGSSASVSASTLAAGVHSIVAVYSGDATHAAAQSAALAVTVTPLGLTAAASPASILYGQPIPGLSGVLNGVLPQDAGKVSAVFTAAAVALSPAGAYAIGATLVGSAAANYTVTQTAANLTIAQAPSLTSLSSSSANPSAGVSVTFTMQAASTTSGVPTGGVTLLDGTDPLAVVSLSATGSATFTTGALMAGLHSLRAVYAGDVNFLPSTSSTMNLTVGAGSDFTLSVVGAALQNVPAGSAATFNFAFAMQGAALASPITLAVSGAPPGSTVSLNPSSLPPGAMTGSVALTIQTPFARMDRGPGRLGSGSGLLALLLLPAIGLAGRRRLRGSAILIVLTAATCLLFCSLATGCGDRVNVAPESGNAKPYTVTVTGTATGPSGALLQHSATVNLSVL